MRGSRPRSSGTPSSSYKDAQIPLSWRQPIETLQVGQKLYTTGIGRVKGTCYIAEARVVFTH